MSSKRKGVTSPYITQMGHMKGHISVKSNAFSPTCKRLSSQDMVIDNMVAHTKKINSVKPRIDNSVPKAWTTSIKKKDQLRRQAMEKSSSPSTRPSSASQGRSVRPNQHRRGFSSAPVSPANMEQYVDEDSEVLSDMFAIGSPYQTPRSLQSLGDLPPRQRSLAPSGGQQAQMNKSFSISGRGSMYSTQMMQQTSSRQQSYDLLDTMATRFTEGGKSHTPRTLRTSAKSKLAQSKYYNPPKRKEKQANRPQDNEEDRPDPVRSANLDRSLRRQELHSRPVERRTEDHIKWVEEQAERVQHLNESFEEDTLGRVNQEETTLQNTDTYPGPIYSARLETMSYRSRSQNEKRMREEEEELRYLEFVTDVTNDVLNRGIYTNTVLKQVFEAHIDRNKDKLEEERMRQLMKQLQRDLAIPGDER
ncbi:Spermatogenesis-associated protein 7 [Holothuria leucospilota]|uniref:Spermatogenesis-associated protein 7 n=1 Tax=Holothuria leucospilota TaxID=206669 RepID=A0A9Q1CIR2_HOLLE|nr:Spermatogenesis-associated protein 7 [Holothuria leucospilota]